MIMIEKKEKKRKKKPLTFSPRMRIQMDLQATRPVEAFITMRARMPLPVLPILPSLPFRTFRTIRTFSTFPIIFGVLLISLDALRRRVHRRVAPRPAVRRRARRRRCR